LCISNERLKDYISETEDSSELIHNITGIEFKILLGQDVVPVVQVGLGFNLYYIKFETICVLNFNFVGKNEVTHHQLFFTVSTLNNRNNSVAFVIRTSLESFVDHLVGMDSKYVESVILKDLCNNTNFIRTEVIDRIINSFGVAFSMLSDVEHIDIQEAFRTVEKLKNEIALHFPE
jgi:hypothetical protein